LVHGVIGFGSRLRDGGGSNDRPPSFDLMNNDPRDANWIDRVLYLLGRRQAFIVEGGSMSPTLNGGDCVMISPAKTVKVGDIVLAQHPYRSSVKILKRVSQIENDGRLHLSGDNPSESTDSRTFGSVSVESVIGLVACRLK